MKIKFKCPSCGSDDGIEEVMHSVYQLTPVTGVELTKPMTLNYGNASTEGGEVDRYQCINCGMRIAESNVELFDFLKERNMLEDE